MKTTLVKQIFKISITFCAAALLSILSSCEKESVFTPDLALNQNAILLPQQEGETRIIVHADNSWSAESLADWITLSATSGTTNKGKGEFIAYVTDNTDKMPRKGEIQLKANGKISTLYIKQQGFKTKLEFGSDKASLRAIANSTNINLTCNVDYTQIEQTIAWETEGQTDWIYNTKYDPETGKFYYDVLKNVNDKPRVATITLKTVDPIGTVLTTSLTITQLITSDADTSDPVDFDYVCQFASSTISANKYIIGVVISEKGNPNMGTNAEDRSNSVPAINYDENKNTVYIQSLDGTKGYRLRTTSEDNNQFQLGDKVWLWLKGLTVTKEAGYTLSGVTTEHMIYNFNDKDYRVCHQRRIGQLTDDDVYTYRELTDLEVALPEGCWSNINDGYVARVDVYPTRMRDINGDQICMLINSRTEWRRVIAVTNAFYNYTFTDESKVKLPKGSGNMKGIIVNETSPHVITRYGNSVGRYSIRAVNREEITIDPEESNGFSKVIAKWTKFPTDNVPTEETPYLASEIEYDTYHGKLCHSYVNKGWSALYYNGSKSIAGVTGSNDFTGTDGSHYPSTHPRYSFQKGWVTNGSLRIGDGLWWIDGKPTWWYVEFSSLGINSLISFHLSIFSNTTGYAPHNFAAEYSLDNNNWTLLGNFTSEDMVDWAATPPHQTPMPKVMSFNLPSDAQNKEKVYVRIIARNTNNMTNNKGESVNYSPSSAKTFYIGDIYVKCNK